MSVIKSKLRPFSLGIVAEDKKAGSRLVHVIPVELVPGMSGEVKNTLTQKEMKGVDKDGVEYTVRLNSSSTIPCHWLPLGSNRISAPDLVKNEWVQIYRYADQDKYYWKELGLNDELRRTETVIYGWAATDDPEAILTLGENVYSLTVDTDGKHITLHTTQANGEPASFTFSLNTQEGVFTLKDQNDAHVLFNSVDHIIEAKNADGTYVTLDKHALKGFARDLIQLKTEKDAEVDVGGKLSFAIDGAYNTQVKGTASISSDGNLSLITKGNLTAKADGSATVESGGALTAKAGGNFTVEGNGTGNVKSNGPLTMESGASKVVLAGGFVLLN